MVGLTFKNVGQGDSILIEWKKEGKNRIGIVDCNIFETHNPVLKHIIDNSYKCIDFIILSHPHYDHFSGLLALIEYCQQNNIQIKRFLHTSTVTPDYLKSACTSIANKKKLLKLFSKLKQMVKDENIKINTIDDNPDTGIRLSKDFMIEVLSPSSIETDKYIRSEKFPFDEEMGGNNPNANWLSTVLKISNKNYSIILTSDVEKSTLSRIGKVNYERLNNSKILIAQCPHHGAKKNLNKIFWRKRKRHEITPIIISVGPNKYNHPSDQVINFFDKTSNYKIIRTDQMKVGTVTKKAQTTSQILDIFSINTTSTTKKSNSQIKFNLLDSTFQQV